MQDPSPFMVKLVGRWDGWRHRRLERVLDKAPIGSERLDSAPGNYLFYYPHGWESAGQVRVQTSVGLQDATRYRKVREADSAAVAQLHQRLGLQP